MMATNSREQLRVHRHRATGGKTRSRGDLEPKGTEDGDEAGSREWPEEKFQKGRCPPLIID